NLSVRGDRFNGMIDCGAQLVQIVVAPSFRLGLARVSVLRPVVIVTSLAFRSTGSPAAGNKQRHGNARDYRPQFYSAIFHVTPSFKVLS
ncbi:MAG: hypothetical protein K5678_11995, partial [Acetatifactor sp.]|nr:hypothetical protein [Acetatifactor sp.]